MVNLKILEELRTKEEVLNYFKQLGKEITEDELNKLKQSYDQAQESSNALTLEQLDDIAGGGSVVTVFIQHERCRFDHLDDQLLRTANGENTFMYGGKKIGIGVRQVDGGWEAEHVSFNLSLDAEKDFLEGNEFNKFCSLMPLAHISLTAKQFQEHFGEDFIRAMHDAYGELTPESLPSRKEEGVTIDNYGTVIPIGSLSHAIEGLNNLLTYNSEGFNFNGDRTVLGKTVEESFAILKGNAVECYVNDYIRSHIDLTPLELIKHFHDVGTKDKFFSQIIKERRLDDPLHIEYIRFSGDGGMSIASLRSTGNIERRREQHWRRNREREQLYQSESFMRLWRSIEQSSLNYKNSTDKDDK